MFKPYVPTKTLEELTAEGFVSESVVKDVYTEDKVLCYSETSSDTEERLVKPLEIITELSSEELQEYYRKYSRPADEQLVKYKIIKGNNLEARTIYIDYSRLLNAALSRKNRQAK